MVLVRSALRTYIAMEPILPHCARWLLALQEDLSVLRRVFAAHKLMIVHLLLLRRTEIDLILMLTFKITKNEKPDGKD